MAKTLESNRSLSDRLEESVKDVKQKVLNSTLVQNLLMKGEVNEQNKRIAKKGCRYAKDIVPGFVQMVQGTLKICTPEEKAFFQRSIDFWVKKFDEFDAMVEEAIGAMDADISSLPVRDCEKAYVKYLASIGENPISVVRVLAVFLAIQRPLVYEYEYVIQNSNYKPNPFLWILTCQPMEVKQFTEQLKDMIDRRAPPVGSEEEREIFELFRKTSEIDSTYILSDNFD